MTEADEGLEHAWKWFELHSRQRFVTMNFFMVMSAGILAGAATLLKDGQQLACAVLGFALMTSAILFLLMDRRARRLVKVGEAALVTCESRLADEIQNPALNLVIASDRAQPFEFTYSRLLAVFYLFFAIVGLILVWYPLTLGVASPGKANPSVGASKTTGPPPGSKVISPEPTGSRHG